MTNWKTIESAPRDGTSFLGWHIDFEDGNASVVFFEESEMSDIVASDGHVFEGKEWCWATMDGPTLHKDFFTHWMPLPPPPSETE